MTHELINPTTVALALLLVVLLVAATSRLWVAIATSVAAMLVFNFFFLPPVGTFTIADPQNWVALFAFLVVSVVASQLSATARLRTREAVARRDEMARLVDVSRDVLLVTDSGEAIAHLARFIARRFDLEGVAIAQPVDGGWDVQQGGQCLLTLGADQLSDAMDDAARSLGFDARERTHAGHRAITVDGRSVRVMPLRMGTRPIGVLAAAGRQVDPGSLDALAGIAAIAIERIQFLEERKAAELARQSEALKSALLASIAHDLRTPLTTIRVAAGNLQSSWLAEPERREQGDLVVTEVDRLNRLFENILEMARIDAGAVSTTERWVALSEIIEAARAQVGAAVGNHAVDVQIPTDAMVRVDPRLTASALAHLIENAAKHAPAGSAITIAADASAIGLLVSVRDLGPGIAPSELPHLFERFYRGADAKRRVSGTGMGLSIARGLLAAEHGRIWAENCVDGGARFTIAVPAEHRPIEAHA